MPKTAPFERFTDRYESWFEENEHAYAAEVEALRRLLPDGYGVEIGVGSGRFADPLGLSVGLDPAAAMLERARARGVDVVRGVAEALPFRDGVFDAALIVTTICFVDDVEATLAEARRVLRPNGALVVGFIDKESPVGQVYQERKESNPFYRDATFLSTAELLDVLESVGFTDFEFTQTVYEWPGDMTSPGPVEAGYGDGSFVGVKATY